MGLQLCVLASGSSGNCTLVRSADTAILVDAGLSARETARRLNAVGTYLGSGAALSDN
jgi:phosphoribosyl 1,2-cyclic phosphodiesterase